MPEDGSDAHHVDPALCAGIDQGRGDCSGRQFVQLGVGLAGDDRTAGVSQPFLGKGEPGDAPCRIKGPVVKPFHPSTD